MKGTYTLLIEMSDTSEIEIGSLGQRKFEEGVYIYVGSALGDLEKRVERHLRSDKSLHWHIDYLLEYADVEDVYYGECEERKECEISRSLAEDFSSMKDFGSSDCNCTSHLYYAPDFQEAKERLVISFRNSDLSMETW